MPALPPRPRTASTNLVVAALATCVVVASLGWWAGRATAPTQRDRLAAVEVLVAGHPSDHQVPAASPPGNSVATGPTRPSASTRATSGSTPTPTLALTSAEPSPSPSATPAPLPTVTVRSTAKCVAPGLGYWEIKAQAALSTSRGVVKIEAIFTAVDEDGEEEDPSGIEPMSANGSTYARALPTRPVRFVKGSATWFARVTMADGRVVESANRSHEVPFAC